MKRSTINHLILDAKEFIASRGFYLPPFAYWSPEDWRLKGPEVAEIVSNALGWDITDFGSGDYETCGLMLFTVRNGHPRSWETLSGKLYAEKIMVVGVDQVTPFHYHWHKIEDIINRGGGDLVIQVYNTTESDGLADTPVQVSTDGVLRAVAAGGLITLKPGESITIPARLYHAFWGERSRVMVGEVSLVNDDTKDNRFLEPRGRFPEVEEDEAPLHLLMTDYKHYWGGGER